MCLHMNQTGAGSTGSKQEKPDYPVSETDPPVLSRPAAVRGGIRLRRGAPPPVKRHLDG
jgi:hypothetical protein